MAIYSEADTYEMSHKADQVKILVGVAVDCGMEKNADLFKYLFERVYYVPYEVPCDVAEFAEVFGETMSTVMAGRYNAECEDEHKAWQERMTELLNRTHDKLSHDPPPMPPVSNQRYCPAKPN